MLFEAFKRNREERPHAAAFLVSTGDRAIPITWRQFTDDIDAVARIIRAHVPDSTIGILGENSYEWMVVHAAILFSGAVVTPIDSNLNAVEIAARLKFIRASALVYSSLYEEKAHEVARLCPGLATGGFGTRKTDQYVERARKALAADPTESLWSAESRTAPRFSTDEHVSMLVFTSGTTSEPRGAELTIAGLESCCAAWGAAVPMKSGERSLMLLPLHHIFGMSTTYLMLMHGVALGVCPDFRRLYDAFERFRVNYAFLVPALADILAQKIQQKGSSAEEALGQPLDWILTGGAALPRRTYEHLLSLGIRVITGYGLTETTAMYSVTPLAGDPHVGSQGRVSLVAGIETKVSESGELLIRGPCVMKGYYRLPKKTAEVLEPDGWYHTGDLGRIDGDGYVWITGRASRTIVLSSGKKVAPEELEEKLLSLPGIREAVVSGEGESRDIRAEVFSRLPEASVVKVIGELNALLPVYKRIKTIVVRKEPFPRTSSGKIRVG